MENINDMVKITLAIASMIMQLNGGFLYSVLHQKRQNQLFLLYLKRQRKTLVRKIKRLHEQQLSRQPKTIWHISGRDDTLWKNMLKGITPESEWRANFRFNQNEFMQLVEKLRHYISPDPNSPNHCLISAEKRLAVTLYYLILVH